MSAVDVVPRDSAAAPWSGPVMVDATSKRVERLVGSKRKELAALDDEFLQRTLGGLQDACLHKEKLVSDLAFALRCPYEDVLPKVDARMQSARPLDRKQRIANRKKAAPQIRAAVEALTQKFGKNAEAGTVRARRRGGRA